MPNCRRGVFETLVAAVDHDTVAGYVSRNERETHQVVPVQMEKENMVELGPGRARKSRSWTGRGADAAKIAEEVF